MKKTALSLFAVALIAACSAGNDETMSDTNVASGDVQGGAPASEAAATPATPGVTDPQIAAIVVAANNADVEGGRMAASKSTNAKVKEFAQRMITDHNGVNKAAVALVTKLGVTPEESAASRQQTESGEKSRASLKGMKGVTFDRAYMANEVTYHENLLSAIDQLLIPSAQNGELKALLEQTRPAVVDHLRHARELQSSLAAS